MKRVSIGNMIEQISGMADTQDLTDWENEFVKSIAERYRIANRDSRFISSKQCEIIERIWEKHFA